MKLIAYEPNGKSGHIGRKNKMRRHHEMTGKGLRKTGLQLAEDIMRQKPDTEVLVAQSYEMMPIVVSTVIALSDYFGKNCGWCLLRQEEKDHGEGKRFIGCKPEGKVLMLVDEV